MCDDLGINDEKVDVYFVKSNMFDDENVYLAYLKEELIEGINMYIDDLNEHDEELILNIKVQRMTMDKYQNLPEYE